MRFGFGDWVVYDPGYTQQIGRVTETPYRVAKDSGIPLGTIYSLGAREACTFATYDRLRRSLARLAESARSTA